MGYKPQAKTYELIFTDFPGLEVKAKSASLGEITYMSQLTVNISETDDAKRLEVFKFFADRLLSWNMEHPEVTGGVYCSRCNLAEDTPMPTTVEAMQCLDLDLIMAIIVGWINAVGRVTIPKGMNLSDGEKNTLETEVMKRLEELQNPMPSLKPNLS